MVSHVNDTAHRGHDFLAVGDRKKNWSDPSDPSGLALRIAPTLGSESGETGSSAPPRPPSRARAGRDWEFWTPAFTIGGACRARQRAKFRVVLFRSEPSEPSESGTVSLRVPAAVCERVGRDGARKSARLCSTADSGEIARVNPRAASFFSVSEPGETGRSGPPPPPGPGSEPGETGGSGTPTPSGLGSEPGEMGGSGAPRPPVAGASRARRAGLGPRVHRQGARRARLRA